MSTPVIFDDGGSTRLKLVNAGFGAMNTLLDVDTSANPPASSAIVNGPFNRIIGVTIDMTGTAATFLNTALNANDTFLITSDGGQALAGSIDAGGRCTITLAPSQGNSPAPLVEAKQFKKKRRYVVSNAGPILSVSLNNVVMFNAIPLPAPNATVYSTVILQTP